MMAEWYPVLLPNNLFVAVDIVVEIVPSLIS